MKTSSNYECVTREVDKKRRILQLIKISDATDKENVNLDATDSKNTSKQNI